MCRLFGFRSAVPSRAHRSLVEAENAVRWSRFDSQFEDLQELMDVIQQRFRTFSERRKRLLAKADSRMYHNKSMRKRDAQRHVTPGAASGAA